MNAHRAFEKCQERSGHLRLPAHGAPSLGLSSETTPAAVLGASSVSSQEPGFSGFLRAQYSVHRALHPCCLCWEQPHRFLPSKAYSFSTSHVTSSGKPAFLDSFGCSLNTMSLSSKALEGYPFTCVSSPCLLVFLRHRLPVFRVLPPPPRTPFSAEHSGPGESFHSLAAGQGMCAECWLSH